MPLIAVAAIEPPANLVVGDHVAMAVHAGQAADAPADPPPARVRRRVRFVDDNQGLYISISVTRRYAMAMGVYSLQQELRPMAGGAGGTRFYQTMALRVGAHSDPFLDEELLRLVLVLRDVRRLTVNQLVTLLLGLADCSVLPVCDSHLRLPTSSRIHYSCL